MKRQNIIIGETPFFVPFCCSCDEPAEGFTIHPAKSDFFVEFEAQCHGKTEWVKVSWQELQGHGVGHKIRCFQRRQGFDSVR